MDSCRQSSKKYNAKNTILFVILLSITSKAQNTLKFPIDKIDNTIIIKRKLEDKIKFLIEECNWSERIGKKIDVFWMKTQKGNLFGHSYEYFMDCDNLRFIYWYDNPSGSGRPIDFMIENLEDESLYVVAKKKHLKNKKKYKYLLE